MELTLTAMFSTDGLIGNLSYILLIASMAMRNIVWLRVLAIGSGLLGIYYDAVILNDPVGTFWETCFTLVNLGQWIWLRWERSATRLSADEARWQQQYFPSLETIEAKRLFAAADHRRFESGDVLIVQGAEVSSLLLLLDGLCTIEVDGTVVAQCGAGDYLGEMSYLSGEPTSATVRAEGAARALEFSRSSLALLAKGSPTIANEINRAIGVNLSRKLQLTHAG